MSPLGNIIRGLGGLLHSLITVYIWVLIIAAVISWVRPDPYNPIIQILTRLTEPAYALVRRYVPSVMNGIDLAPLILIVGLNIIDIILVQAIASLAYAI